FKISKQCLGPAKFDKKGCLDMKDLPKISKAAINDLIKDLEDDIIEAIDIMYWNGDHVHPIDIKYKTYIGLKKNKKSGTREVIVYNPDNKMIELINYCVHREIIEQKRDRYFS
ncbi:MAG: hypothetical protein QW666_03290, partial [Candidatus Woesearchaeota archaeon]